MLQPFGFTVFSRSNCCQSSRDISKKEIEEKLRFIKQQNVRILPSIKIKKSIF